MSKYKNPTTIEEILGRMLYKYGPTYTPPRKESYLTRNCLTADSVRKPVGPAAVLSAETVSAAETPGWFFM